MKASDISYELSIRLGDPIGTAGTPDAQGLVFSGDQRLRYISRAYSKLTRLLKILMRDYQPEFNKRRGIKTIEFVTPAGINKASSIVISDNVKIDELYVTFKAKDKDAKTVVATYMEPSTYLTNKYNPNDVKDVSFETNKIKYTTMITGSKKVLVLLPIVDSENYYTKVEYLEIPDFKISSWNDEIPITGDYIDLLIDLAAIQGMQDINRGDKASLIERSLGMDWQILGQYGTYMKQTEGVEE